VTKAAFDKIKAGLVEAKAYLDGSGNKRSYGVHVSARVKKIARALVKSACHSAEGARERL
jgi:hypothetical protein